MRKLLLLISLAFALQSWADSPHMPDTLRYELETSTTLAKGEHTPFWLFNNRNGLATINKNNWYFRSAVFRDMDESQRFSWGAGVDAAATYGYTEQTVIVRQFYAEAKYRSLDIMAGAKIIPEEISNPDLATGNLLFSNNHLPIPQVRIGIFDYTPMWGTNNWVAVKGHMAFGRFFDNNWIEEWVDKSTQYTLSTLYHSKGGFMRIGDRTRFPLEFEWGIEMATQFGGTTYNYGRDKKTLHNPTKLIDWLKAVIPMGGGADTPMEEQANVQGNMLGSWNFALTWNPAADWRAKLYYLHYFEDHSMMTFDFPWKDGLWGIEVNLPKNRWVSDVVAEFIYTKDQSGPVYWDHTPEINEQVSGRDNYYNHFIYNGWQYYGMMIGNPMIISPVYNNPHKFGFMSNRIVGYHLGFRGNPTDEVDYKLLATTQTSWGRYPDNFPEPRKTFNLLLQGAYSPKALNGWRFEAALAMDRGDLIGNNYGAMFTISKTGFLSLKHDPAPKRKRPSKKY